jgi:hypothetical protein
MPKKKDYPDLLFLFTMSIFYFLFSFILFAPLFQALTGYVKMICQN